MTEIEIAGRLPEPDHDIDCVDDRGDFAISPCWEFKARAFGTAENVAAYRDCVVIVDRGAASTYDTDSADLLDLERDALAVLAAIHQHRAWAEATA